jgi:hypothetical protein
MTRAEAVAKVRDEVLSLVTEEVGDGLREAREKMNAPGFVLNPEDCSNGIETVDDAKLVLDVVEEALEYIRGFGMTR